MTADRRLAEVELERDLYRRLLEIALHDEPHGLLEEALALIVGSTGATRGFLALFGDEQETPRWWLATGFSEPELETVRRTISSGIISTVLTTGQPVVLTSAMDDPTHGEQASIVRNRIQAVMCLPIGASAGVIYLQDRRDGGPFPSAALEHARLFARHLAPAVDRVRLRGGKSEDPTAPFRARLRLDALVGRSRAMAEVFGQVEGAARFAVPVLITGDSGTGKTMLARAIHDNGPRAAQPFLELNCAAIPETLFESELFGALPGAHSTATRKIAGKIAAAQGGTLFLDEIGELPLAVQGKLLQFLQSREYFPLGASVPERANVRIIAATNQDLRAATEARTFREDLFYRLNVLAIAMPRLAERREDVTPLARAVCAFACSNNDLPPLALSPSAMMALEAAEWPGNVRQLAHAVEAAAIRAAMSGSQAIEPRHVFPDDTGPALAAPQAETFQEATRRFQARLLRETLDAAEWNISETARRLDLTRTHVRHLIRAFALKSPKA